jgi:hypothetical protein
MVEDQPRSSVKKSDIRALEFSEIRKSFQQSGTSGTLTSQAVESTPVGSKYMNPANYAPNAPKHASTTNLNTKPSVINHAKKNYGSFSQKPAKNVLVEKSGSMSIKHEDLHKRKLEETPGSISVKSSKVSEQVPTKSPSRRPQPLNGSNKQVKPSTTRPETSTAQTSKGFKTPSNAKNTSASPIPTKPSTAKAIENKKLIFESNQKPALQPKGGPSFLKQPKPQPPPNNQPNPKKPTPNSGIGTYTWKRNAALTAHPPSPPSHTNPASIHLNQSEFSNMNSIFQQDTFNDTNYYIISGNQPDPKTPYSNYARNGPIDMSQRSQDDQEFISQKIRKFLDHVKFKAKPINLDEIPIELQSSEFIAAKDSVISGSNPFSCENFDARFGQQNFGEGTGYMAWDCQVSINDFGRGQQNKILNWKSKKDFRLKAKIFESLLNNIVVAYEEGLEVEEILRAKKLGRVFAWFSDALLSKDEGDPVLRDLSDMVVELRKIKMMQKVFEAFKR